MTERVQLTQGFDFGPRKGATGTVVGKSERGELIRVHFDGDPEHRTYGVPASDLRQCEQEER
ncbi:hypothetical protein R2325_16945 [Mycobacteroides chelonae]|uniref:hypothetical protein n=1 Tax=Mycobacteroides chelonae TaxID=1774 RepID=UPI002DEC9ADF|nr:hypothetical protein [Mycobacteroides chelonae]MEC4871707.1 hypothetical protein [Mycobacteroides chelonae]